MPTPRERSSERELEHISKNADEKAQRAKDECQKMKERGRTFDKCIEEAEFKVRKRSPNFVMPSQDAKMH